MKKLTPAVLCAALLASTATQAQTVTLKIAHFLPSTSNVQVNVFEPWCEQLSAESDNRIRCQLYPSMQLGGTPARLADMARNGVADIVWTAPAYSAGKFPRIEALELPFMLPFGAQASDPIIWDFYQQYAHEDFKDYKVLLVHGDGGMNLHLRSKPVRTLEDMSGLKVRASSRTAARTLESLGMKPVSMPPAQMTEAISKGVVDGALASWEVVPATKLDEVTRYHSVEPQGQNAMGYTVLTMLMNQRKFASMPEDLQQIIERNSGPALSERVSAVWDQLINEAREQAPDEGLVAIDVGAYQAMQAATSNVAEEWVNSVTSKRINGQALLDGVHALSSANR